MKSIVKSEPDFYTKEVKKKPSTWNEVREIREDLRGYILENEQSYQCAYTEKRLHKSASSSHLDHFKKQDDFPNLRFDYNNIFVADKHEEYGAKFKDKFIKKADYDKLLHPCNDDIDGRFRYLISTGEIEQNNNDDIKAGFTISAFNLNHTELCDLRYDIARFVYENKQFYALEQMVQLLGRFESLVRYIYS